MADAMIEAGKVSSLIRAGLSGIEVTHEVLSILIPKAAYKDLRN